MSPVHLSRLAEVYRLSAPPRVPADYVSAKRPIEADWEPVPQRQLVILLAIHRPKAERCWHELTRIL